ncbi:SAM-dependent methyltransferase [Symbioplanes lichenis]|uniref:SAM-dependent methyltransferase n=1 Tax=Symbioplanes lichenis TaxID=1629072 RepID=UPI00273981D6|nr:SAM-dependent methyltransferase [Actinoplanes lichenis]
MPRTPGDAQPPEESFSLDHFVNLYLAKDDPWDNAFKWSDQRKYAVTLASLPRERYRRAYEPGCAVGILTRLLAARCDSLLATDAVPDAVATARSAVADLPNVEVDVAVLPADLPPGTFDLIVIGDLLYYLSAADLQATVDGLVSRLDPAGDLAAVHFRDRDNGGNFDGFNAHAALLAHPSLEPVVHHEDDWFLLDILRRR